MNATEFHTSPAQPFEIIGYDSDGVEMQGEWNDVILKFSRPVTSFKASIVDTVKWIAELDGTATTFIYKLKENL